MPTRYRFPSAAPSRAPPLPALARHRTPVRLAERWASGLRGDYNSSLELALTIAEYFRLPVEAIFSLKPMTPLSREIFREPPAEAR